MTIEIKNAVLSDGPKLADLRVAAMKPSLQAIDRFDEVRARDRFLSSFDPSITWKIHVNSILNGCYTFEVKEDHIWISHFYLHPTYQNRGIGNHVLHDIKHTARTLETPIRLGALKGSRSNDFYKAQGFVKTHQTQWDIYYVYR